MRQLIASIRSRGTPQSTTSAEAALRSNDSQPLSSFSSNDIASDPLNTSVIISDGLPDSQENITDQGTISNEGSEMEESTFGGDADSADDSTFSLDEASSSCSAISISARKTGYQEQLWQSELPFSHNLAILFIKSVRTQGRIECFMRKRYARLTRATKSNDWMITGSDSKRKSRRRKRKCSEEFTPDDLALALQLKESFLPMGSSCSSTDSTGGSSDQSLVEEMDASTFTSRSYSDHGLNSRKVKSSSNLQV